jgi:hypothetical protein
MGSVPQGLQGRIFPNPRGLDFTAGGPNLGAPFLASFCEKWESHHCRSRYKSCTLNPVCFAMRASIFGPISTPS